MFTQSKYRKKLVHGMASFHSAHQLCKRALEVAEGKECYLSQTSFWHQLMESYPGTPRMTVPETEALMQVRLEGNAHFNASPAIYGRHVIAQLWLRQTHDAPWHLIGDSNTLTISRQPFIIQAEGDPYWPKVKVWKTRKEGPAIADLFAEGTGASDRIVY